MTERAFVLAPLAEIAPGLTVKGAPAADRLAALDAAGIERLPSGRDWWQLGVEGEGAKA
jgi:2-amino-4-hydroxy-6-hydroxymethyldihydropteridine diphosphokinase